MHAGGGRQPRPVPRDRYRAARAAAGRERRLQRCAVQRADAARRRRDRARAGRHLCYALQGAQRTYVSARPR